jgi:hypothetical protein
MTNRARTRRTTRRTRRVLAVLAATTATTVCQSRWRSPRPDSTNERPVHRRQRCHEGLPLRVLRQLR